MLEKLNLSILFHHVSGERKRKEKSKPEGEERGCGMKREFYEMLHGRNGGSAYVQGWGL